ncbi:MAG: GAF domain-containing protein [Chitinivibrionales bacterium]|nr:GAF domain-containing protein [Chitinivibrionales bacterium]
MQKKKAHITQTQALIELSQAINSRIDLFGLLRLIKGIATRLIDADRASIFILDKRRKSLWTLMADGETVIDMPASKGIVGEVIKKNESCNVADVNKDNRFYNKVDKQTGYETRSLLCSPMRNREGAALGAIELLNKHNGAFTAHDEQLVNILAAQAGLAIEHIEMNEDIRHNIKQLELLFDIQKNINVSMEIEQIFEIILSKVIAAVKGECGIIQTVTAQGITGYHGFHPDFGSRFWEEDDRRSCPQQLLKLLDQVDEKAATLMKSPFYADSTLLYSPLTRENLRLGYIAILRAPAKERLFNDIPVDYLKILAEQTVSLLNKMEAIDEKKRSEKQALLGAMLSNIVHDLKNPLSGISGFAQLIKRKSDDVKIQSYCDIMLETLDRIGKMNSELLFFVRGESITLEKQSFLLNDLFAEITYLLSEKYRQSNISFELKAREEINVVADKDRLARVFTNFISNAKEAMEDGGTITIELRKKENSAIIKIIDSGRGIPGHVQERLFQPFVTYGKKNGTGLGMSIARSIIEKHEGRIKLKSMLGKGTTFTITIPCDT